MTLSKAVDLVRDALGPHSDESLPVSECVAKVVAELSRLQAENDRLLSNPTVRHLNDAWLAEEQIAIDALLRAEKAEALLTAREAALQRLIEEMKQWCADNNGHYHEDDVEEVVKRWADTLAALKGDAK